MTPLILLYGAGVNSNAVLEEMRKRGIRPDAIVFADTAGERPETYETISFMQQWCARARFPTITICKHHGGLETADSGLESECLRLERLPSIAYGFKSCSDKWKRRPIDAWLKSNGIKQYRKAIGFDAGEERRVRPDDSKHCENWYPLIEWGIYREDCEAICMDAGLPVAKSSCFFCPSMKKSEILELARLHPDLAVRAVAMEENAHLDSIKGLGRRFSWKDFLNANERQRELFSDLSQPEVPCGCYDG